jgi:hypothetical protein
MCIQRHAHYASRTHGTTTFVACSWHPYCAKKVASGLTVLPGMNIGRSRKPANIVSSEKCNIQYRHRIHDAVKPLRSFGVDYGAYSSQIDSITRLTSVIRNDPLMVDRRQSWFQGFCPILNRPFSQNERCNKRKLTKIIVGRIVTHVTTSCARSWIGSSVYGCRRNRHVVIRTNMICNREPKSSPSLLEGRTVSYSSSFAGAQIVR